MSVVAGPVIRQLRHLGSLHLDIEGQFAARDREVDVPPVLRLQLRRNGKAELMEKPRRVALGERAQAHRQLPRGLKEDRGLVTGGSPRDSGDGLNGLCAAIWPRASYAHHVVTSSSSSH